MLTSGKDSAAMCGGMVVVWSILGQMVVDWMGMVDILVDRGLMTEFNT